MGGFFFLRKTSVGFISFGLNAPVLFVDFDCIVFYDLGDKIFNIPDSVGAINASESYYKKEGEEGFPLGSRDPRLLTECDRDCLFTMRTESLKFTLRRSDCVSEKDTFAPRTWDRYAFHASSL